jgi:hypothetical protein
MLIIIDHTMSPEAKRKLSSYGKLMELKTEGITYPAISAHPDIFFCQAPGQLIVAPNLPQKYLDKLIQYRIAFAIGEFPVGSEYPASARYNAVATKNLLIHNFRHTDFMITRTFEDHTPVHVDQGYTRCNLLPLNDVHFITSDEGIYKVLMRCHLPSENKSRCHLNVLYVAPAGIKLDGFPHGFFGGCCGVWEDKVFINGSLSHYAEGEKVKHYLDGLNYEIVELYDGRLADVGSILFVK